MIFSQKTYIKSLIVAFFGAIIALFLGNAIDTKTASADVPSSGGGDGYPSDSGAGTAGTGDGGPSCCDSGCASV